MPKIVKAGAKAKGAQKKGKTGAPAQKANAERQEARAKYFGSPGDSGEMSLQGIL